MMDKDIRAKQSLIKSSFRTFEKRISTIQKAVLSKVLEIIDLFAVENGRIDRKQKSNKTIARRINREQAKILRPTTFRSDVSKFLKNFDDVERIQKKILEQSTGLNLKDFDLSIEKQEIIDDITLKLLSEDMIKANLINPISRILYRHVTTGIPVTEARKELREFINQGKNGYLGRHVKTLTQESLSRYDGTINQRIAAEFKLDAFRIVGSLIKTSLPICEEMINETGAFKELVVNGKYPMKHLQQIVDIAKQRPGVVNGLTVNNYFIYRNHWGCRHTLIPTRLLQRDKEELTARGIDF